ncbi:hypothetical protein BV22DRAFT_206982 [Leucogyrophana mollusca]|uniref:Uncharacterized protein n=1 Tax=Leucogyrophana mollusca TaxID=85980 RepID=A0ACB8BRW2_9AGAM|nr:hypothetical protein BV22DRAFT_206982 [Leucogyrophana mollusca]
MGAVVGVQCKSNYTWDGIRFGRTIPSNPSTASCKPNHYLHLFCLPFRSLSLICSDKNFIIMMTGPLTSRSGLSNHLLVCLGRTGLSNRSFALVSSSTSTTGCAFSWWSQPVQSPLRLDFSGMRHGCCVCSTSSSPCRPHLVERLERLIKL